MIPGRKKGYYRAVRSGKEWALKIHRLKEGSLQWMLAFTYRCVKWEELMYNKNPFLSMIPKDGFTGTYLPIPIKFGEDK